MVKYAKEQKHKCIISENNNRPPDAVLQNNHVACKSTIHNSSWPEHTAGKVIIITTRMY